MNHVYMQEESSITVIQEGASDTIMNYVLFMTAIVCLIAIGILTMMGVSYAEEGHGLHPIIVSVGVSLLSILGYKACAMVCED